ncbi:MAG: acetyl-CoA carboxylase biotin carboxyl carrier protein [Proteobacteria bacterium]|nr:acetyl-CoA carboxylase biotin carboxyl carrier protein [Pseudomonadota bacterium]
MDLKEIKALYRFFKNTDLVELETEGESGRVRFKRGEGQPVEMLQVAPASSAVAVAAVSEPAKTEPVELPEENIETISSPMVGTFYRAPSPEAPAFIQVGDLVKKGQPVCLIEAMKLMNDVESEFSGKVVDILVENGQPIEYGEPLIKVEV